MSRPQLKLDFVPVTDAHLAGFAHKHPMEHRSASIDHVAGSTFLVTKMLTRETHTLDMPDIGTFIFDVTSIKLVLSRKIIPFDMARAQLTQSWVDYAYKAGGCEEDGIARFKTADLDRPGIMVLFGDSGRNATIDGNHRLVRSWRDGRETYDMAIVQMRDIVPFVCRPGAEDVLFEAAKALEEELGRL